MQIHNSVLRNIVNIFLILCCLALIVIAVCFDLSLDADAAEVVTKKYTGYAVTNLNVRSGPGTDYKLLRSISAGTTFQLTGATYNDGQRTYWRLYGEAEEWVTGGTNGANLTVTTTNLTTYTDTITGFAANGSIPWEHTCIQTVPEWYYHIKVNNVGYVITCDCGWTYDRIAWNNSGLDPTDPDYVFLGIDTDNNEYYDLKPGQSIDIPCRANTNLRPYIISEFFGSTANDPPTVTVGFFDVDGNEIAIYKFNWWATIHVESHGVVMVDMNGKRVVHPVNGEFMLWFDHGQFYLDDTPHLMKHGSLFGADLWDDGRHVSFRFTIKMVDNEDMNPLDWVIYWSKKIGTWCSDVFNFFGIGDLLYSDDSPFVDIFSFDGVQSFFATIKDFFAGLPPELITVISIGFAGTLIIGLVRWFL